MCIRDRLDADGDYHQISDGIIQIENEYYDSIRPKRASENELRPYDQLKKHGIEYLEIRGVDIDPNEPLGISKHHVRFLDLFLLYCLVSPSSKISNEEKLEIDKNDIAAVYRGRDKETEISIKGSNVNLHEERIKVFDDLKILAQCMKNSEELIQAINYVSNYEKGSIPSLSYQEHGIIKANEMMAKLRNGKNINFDTIKNEAELSLHKLENMPINTDNEMNEYVKNYNDCL